ncbi:hypothetical protein [Streptomyces sp. NBC_00576]|uniref:hypothetical protein n=1 Tax=Streptomyces sp. NBC_00576 TaxID=2903665 RepID=UPI002E7FBD1D|nr:hypothetical protein [Streptomyces sp. NBC_00576]WUB71776.1 hypothetical protein OG734_17645 [Streptomyces sp. NBC_00576]
MTTVPARADAPPCDVCDALATQRDAARAAGRTGEADDCERELSEHDRHGRGCTS